MKKNLTSQFKKEFISLFVRKISPLAGKPSTRRTTDWHGNPLILVTPHELTPLRAKVADFFAKVTALGHLAVGLSHLSTVPSPDNLTLAMVFGGPLLMYPVYKDILRWFLSKQTRVAFTPTEFRVKSWIGWRRYDRQLPHKFALHAHDKTQLELEQHEFEKARAARNGEAIKKTRYYGESFHLSFEYLGQRNDVMTIYGRKQAMRVLTRMNVCDELMNAELGNGNGTGFSPEGQWGDRTGGID